MGAIVNFQEHVLLCRNNNCFTYRLFDMYIYKTRIQSNSEIYSTAKRFNVIISNTLI